MNKLRQRGRHRSAHDSALSELSPATIDLFGADQSSNTATFYSSGPQGRYEEESEDDHRLYGQNYKVLEVVDGSCRRRKCPCSTPERGAARRLHQDSNAGEGPLEQRWMERPESTSA